MTGYNFLNINPNELILFPTFFKFGLVYFKIYLKKLSKQLFGSVFEICVNSNIFLNRIFGREKKLSKVLECTLPFHTLKASILNPGIIIFGVIVDTFITPPHFEGLVISCGMIICMNAY